jgi:prophage regulatory protein
MTKKQNRLNSIRTPDRLIRQPEVSHLTGYSKASIYRLMLTNQFPQSVKLGERAVAWRESSIYEWMDSRIAA